MDAYPYSIDTIPLAYGTSQLTKCTVNFYYKKHDIIYNAGLDKEELYDTSVIPPKGNLTFDSIKVGKFFR